MGGKHSKDTPLNRTSLNPNERRRLTVFLESSGSGSRFNHQEMKKLWHDFLIPDLLQTYADFLMKKDDSKKEYIGVDEFVLLYSYLVRGSLDDKAAALARIVGSTRGSEGHDIILYSGLCKYFSDLLESYFLGLKNKNDVNYKSWTNLKQPDRTVIEEIIRGVCDDLPRKNNEVRVGDLERWLSYTGMISILHSYVLGSLYNLEPELKATIIPLAILPTTKTATFLDLSQVVYLNSFLLSENKAKWRFLFSTVSHGESFSKFARCITNEGPILVIIESDQGGVFGGYITPNIAPGPKWVGSSECFLFKLRPAVEVYPSTGYNDHYAYFNMNQSSMPNGLGMGGQFTYWGLWIDSHFGHGECSESCTTYKNYKMLAAQKKFRISKLEAWGVGEPPPTAEEMGERPMTAAGASVLHKDPTASHIMELAGHKTYSKGLQHDNPPE